MSRGAIYTEPISFTTLREQRNKCTENTRRETPEERRRLCAEDRAQEAQRLLPIVLHAALQKRDSWEAYKIADQVAGLLRMYCTLLNVDLTNTNKE